MTSSHTSWAYWRYPLLVSVLVMAGCYTTERPARTASATDRATKDLGTVLEDYVTAPDTNYGFRLVDSVRSNGQTVFTLEMTSQAWLTTNEVNRPVWKHWLNIVRPDNVETSKGLLIISGGNNDGKPPRPVDSNLLQIAAATRSVVAELKMVPNQSLVFAGETEGRKEDSLIAYTWDKFLRTGNSKWPARLPMTKAVVRAMDAVSAFSGSAEGGNVNVDTYVVAGASKRGWTAWTTAAVDKRVIAVIPIVIDVLNIDASLRHHYAAYGFWAPAIRDYENVKIMDWSGTPEFQALMKIEDPYEYRHRLTMPKFILNASGDQFFLPDSSQFYFDDLPGVKYLRYIPNADHSLQGTDAYQSLGGYYRAVVQNAYLPEFSWVLRNDGSIHVTTRDSPSRVLLWQATNPDARDFRLDILGPRWESSTLEPEPDGSYIARVPTPAKGWTAFFVELTFPAGKGNPDLKFTTQVRVVPDVLPYRFVPKPPSSGSRK